MKKIFLLAVLATLVAFKSIAEFQHTGKVISGKGGSSYVYEFNVKYKDNSVRKVKSKIYYSRKHDASYLEYEGKKIYPGETVSISRNEGTITITGFPIQDKWLFQVIRSNINCYSVYAEKGIEYITHIRKSDDYIFYKLSKADSCQVELYSMMNDNQEVQIEMGDAVHAFKIRKTLLWCSFGGLLGVAGFSALSTVFPPAGILTICSATLFSSSLFIGYPIMFNKPEKKRWKAIKLYNEEK